MTGPDASSCDAPAKSWLQLRSPSTASHELRALVDWRCILRCVLMSLKAAGRSAPVTSELPFVPDVVADDIAVGWRVPVISCDLIVSHCQVSADFGRWPPSEVSRNQCNDTNRQLQWLNCTCWSFKIHNTECSVQLERNDRCIYIGDYHSVWYGSWLPAGDGGAVSWACLVLLLVFTVQPATDDGVLCAISHSSQSGIV